MKNMSTQAKVYIITIILCGIGLFGWSMVNFNLKEFWMTLGLSVLASLSLIVKVTGTTERSHYNISFTIYAFSLFLLGAPETITIIVIAHLFEWLWHRYPWYIQCFNIGQYILVAFTTSAVFSSLNPNHILFTTLGVLSVLISVLVFTFLNHLLIGVVIWLARGENFFESGVFDPFTLMLDFTLLIIGAGAAMLWTLNPLAVTIMLIPLYLVYSTLRVPYLERKSETDPKTELYNARYFSQTLESALLKSNDDGSKLTVVMADLDLLRDINNTYGHLAGDEVLIGVARIMKESLRSGDIVARFGGEEFAILLLDMEEQEVYQRIEEIRQKIAAAEFHPPSSATSIKATMSFGIASRIRADQFANDIIHNADLALYHAKLSGRNSTCIYSNENFETLFDMVTEGTREQTAPKKLNLEERTQSNLAPLEQPLPKNPVAIQASTKGEPPPEPIKAVESKRKRPPGLVNLYIGALTISAILICLPQIDSNAAIDWLALALFASLVVVAEWFSIDLYLRNTAVSTSAAPMLAGVLLFGPTGALVLSMTFALTALLKHRSRWNRLIFNFGNQLFAAMVYTWMISQTSNTFSQWNLLAQFAMCLFAAMVVYTFTTFAVTLAIYLDQGGEIKHIWLEQYSWLAPMYLGIGVIAFALTLIYQIAGLPGLAIILVPMYILRFSQKQYLDHTRASVNKLRENNLRLEHQKNKITHLNEELLQALSYVIDMRDPYVLGHSNHVVDYAVLIAQELGLPSDQVELVRKAGLLHDIGKLGISENILHKPAKLTPHEYEIVKKHATIGANIISKVEALQDLVPIVRHHHEHFNGHGYPDGLSREDIPLGARILALADAIEAMASDRPYKRAFEPDEIIAEIQRCSGTQFDPQVVQAFLMVFQYQGQALIKNSTRERVEAETIQIQWPLRPVQNVQREPI